MSTILRAFGEVYVAIEASAPKRKVAIKKMQITPKNARHLLMEIYIQRTSNHPNIVRYYDGYRVEDTLWVALEYMGGGSLTGVLDRRISLSEPYIAYVCREVSNHHNINQILHLLFSDVNSTFVFWYRTDFEGLELHSQLPSPPSGHQI